MLRSKEKKTNAVDCRSKSTSLSDVNGESVVPTGSTLTLSGKGGVSPLSALGKLLSSLPFTMPVGCLPCTKVVDPSRQASKMIEKQLTQWSKKESKVIQLLLIGKQFLMTFHHY